jgi:hypothetical protein
MFQNYLNKITKNIRHRCFSVLIKQMFYIFTTKSFMWPFYRNEIVYFLHIYKTGGTSINDMLARNNAKNKILFLYNQKSNVGRVSDLTELYQSIDVPKTVEVVYGHYAYGIHKHISKKYTYMCFVREPFARTVSMYYHFLRLDPMWQALIRENYLKNENSEIEGFASVESFIGNQEIHNQQCMFLTGFSTEEIAKDQEYYAKMAIENIKREFRFVGVNERFDESLREVSRLLKLKTTEYEYKNLGVNKPLQIENPKEIRDVVHDLSKADEIIYQYVKDNF